MKENTEELRQRGFTIHEPMTAEWNGHHWTIQFASKEEPAYSRELKPKKEDGKEVRADSV